MLFVILILIILYFLFKSDDSSSIEDQNENKYKKTEPLSLQGRSKKEYKKNNNSQKGQDTRSRNTKESYRLDNRINGLDLVVGDTVQMKSKNIYKIIEKNSNGTLVGVEVGTGRETTLLGSSKSFFVLQKNVYVHEDLVDKKVKNKNKYEVDNSWKSKNYSGATTFMLRKNETEEINKVIGNMRLIDEIKLKRNKSARSEVNVYDSKNRLLGSIPKEISSSIAKKMDLGIKYNAKIIGAFGKGGLEILIWQSSKQKGSQSESNKVHKGQDGKGLVENNNRRTFAPSKEQNLKHPKLDGKISKTKNEVPKQIIASDLQVADTIRLKNGIDYVIKDIKSSKSGKNYHLILQSINDGKELKKLVAYFDKYNLVDGVCIASDSTTDSPKTEAPAKKKYASNQKNVSFRQRDKNIDMGSNKQLITRLAEGMYKVKEIRQMLGADFYLGVYDENGYTGRGQTLFGEIPVRRSLTGSYNNRYYHTYQTFINFPSNFIPKKNIPYLCIPKETSYDEGRTTHSKIYLTKPVELISNLHIDGVANGKKVKGICEKTGFIQHGYISVDRKLYVTEDVRPTYPLELTYNEIMDVFIHPSSTFLIADRDPDPYSASYEPDDVYPLLGSKNITQIYKDFHFKLKELILKKLNSQTLKIQPQEIQELIPFYEIRDSKIYSIEGPKKLDSINGNCYEITFGLVAKELGAKKYKDYEYDWHVFSVTKIFRIPASNFSEQMKSFMLTI